MSISLIADSLLRFASDEDAKKELAHVRAEILFHRDSEKKDDRRLYNNILPEGADGMGFMTLPEKVLERNCQTYFKNHPDALERYNYKGNFDQYPTGGEARKEIQRTRSLWRTHKRKKDNHRCWLNDERLYIATIPEGSLILRSDMTFDEAMEQCRIFIPRQKVIWAEASK